MIDIKTNKNIIYFNVKENRWILNDKLKAQL